MTTTTPTPTLSPDLGAATRRSTSTPFTRWLGAAVLVGVVVLVVLGLVATPDDRVQGDAARNMYIHVPSAWLAYLAFIVTGVASAAYLFPRTRSLTWDRIAGASAEVGVLFMGITLVTGSLWGRITWGTYWTWDSRLTTTAFLFVTFIGYLAVRDLGGTHHQRARRSAVLALLSVLEVPLVHFSVMWWRPLHQGQSVRNNELENLMLFTLFLGLIVFTLLYVWLVLHRQRVMAMDDMVAERGLDAALAERRREGVS